MSIFENVENHDKWIEQELFIECGCHDMRCPMLKISCWLSDDWGDFCFSWKARESHMSWWDRIKMAWSILKGEVPFSEDMIVDKEDIVKITEWMKTQASKLEEKEKCTAEKYDLDNYTLKGSI